MKKKEAMEEAIRMMKAVGIANPEVRAHEYPLSLIHIFTYISGGEYTVTDTVAVVTDEKGQEHPVSLMQKLSLIHI